MSIANFPRCHAYLRAMGIRLDDSMTDYWCAVMAAEAFKDKELSAAGTVDFGSGKVAEKDGTAILAALEALMCERAPQLSQLDMDRLRAFFGSRGLKAGKLRTNTHFWETAAILWPAHIKRSRTGDLADLLRQIMAMTKKQRQSAREHVHLVPTEFLAAA